MLRGLLNSAMRSGHVRPPGRHEHRRPGRAWGRGARSRGSAQVAATSAARSARRCGRSLLSGFLRRR